MNEMTTFTNLVQGAFGFVTVPDAPQSTPPGTTCALTGALINEGYPVQEIVSSAQGEWRETFNGQPHGWLSWSAAQCWRATNPKGENRLSKSFAVFGATAYEPMVSEQSAILNNRISWRRLVQDAWLHHRDDPCAISFSTDTKKRIWMRGQVGRLCSRTPVVLYEMNDAGIHELRYINWPQLIEDLLFIEHLYDSGFYRMAVATTLLNQVDQCAVYGWAAAVSAEQRLTTIRAAAHWPLVIIIARGLNKFEERL